MQSTNDFVEWTFLDPSDEVKRLHKAKHEERTQRNAELDEFDCKTVAPEELTPIASVYPMVVRKSDALASVQVWAPNRDQAKTKSRYPSHRLNRWHQVRHRCNQRTIAQRRCQARRSHAFSTGWTDGASEHSIGVMTSAEEGGLTTSSDAMCDRFNRHTVIG